MRLLMWADTSGSKEFLFLFLHFTCFRVQLMMSYGWSDRFAANAILLPSLDMLSNLNQTHAPAIISHILTGRPKASGMWGHWRGRYGLTEEEQKVIWNQVDPNSSMTDDMPNDNVVGIAKDKVFLRFRTFEGEMKEIEAEVGQTLLDVGKANGLPALEGVCGGNLG